MRGCSREGAGGKSDAGRGGVGLGGGGAGIFAREPGLTGGGGGGATE